MVGEAGIEPTTPSLEGSCSIQLSYSPVRVSFDCSGEVRQQGVGKREPCPRSFLGKQVPPGWSKSIVVDRPLCCGENESSGFVVSCGEFQVPSRLYSAYRR